MYKNNADKSLNQKSVPFCQLPIFLRKILANKTALFLYATLPASQKIMYIYLTKFYKKWQH